MSDEPTDPMQNKVLNAYKVARSYITHENNLINSRINSTLLLHGFLLAAFGLMLRLCLSYA